MDPVTSAGLGQLPTYLLSYNKQSLEILVVVKILKTVSRVAVRKRRVLRLVAVSIRLEDESDTERRGASTPCV